MLTNSFASDKRTQLTINNHWNAVTIFTDIVRRQTCIITAMFLFYNLEEQGWGILRKMKDFYKLLITGRIIWIMIVVMWIFINYLAVVKPLDN